MISRACCLAVAVAFLGCVQDPGLQVTACPDLKTFSSVSPVLEQRCGSLDCHGNIARPLRIYGSRGLRYVNIFDPKDAPQLVDPALADKNGTYPGAGGKATTDAERSQSWHALCGLEPEKMTQVTRGVESPEKLLLLTKPLKLERHKGDKVFEKGSQDYDCLLSWLTSAQPGGAVDKQICNESLKNP